MGITTANLFISIDGVYQAPGGPDEDRSGGFTLGGWQEPLGGDEFPQILADIEAMDALLLGRSTYEIFADYWPRQSTDDPISAKLNAVPKFVVSRTLKTAGWEGTTILDDIADAGALRDSYENVHMIGSGALAAAMLDAALIDRLKLWLYPVVLGWGKNLFVDGRVPTTYALAEPPRAFSSGALSLVYERTGGVATGDMT